MIEGPQSEGSPTGRRGRSGRVRLLQYGFRRFIAVGLTIALGMFLTIVVANRGGMVDYITEKAIGKAVANACLVRGCSQEDRDQIRAQITEAYGLNLASLPRQLLWTYNALTLDWGDVWDTRNFRTLYGDYAHRSDSRRIILQHIPNTLLLIGMAYFLLFAAGVPLALYTGRTNGRWLDRTIESLTPLSSIPSWVLGVLLILVFAVQLRFLPAGGMYDTASHGSGLGRIGDLLVHAILPVLAIFLSMFFQLVHTWRTYLMLYADEDYVELGRAKGLPASVLERRYVLKPSLPYFATSLLLTLVVFWQSVTALEYTFGWRGIGYLFVKALPNFTGESFYPGEMSIVIGIVVVFAYLLGIAVLFLDLFYTWIDPRIQFGSQGPAVQMKTERRGIILRLRSWWRDRTEKAPQRAGMHARPTPPAASRAEPSRLPVHRSRRWRYGRVIRQFLRSPGAMAGLILVSVLVSGSLFTLLALPYREYGRSWYVSDLGSHPIAPRLAQPEWVNAFRSNDLPRTIVLDSRTGGGDKVIGRAAGGMTAIDISFRFAYPYTEFPQDVVVYFHPRYLEKAPFVSMIWGTPDGRAFALKNATAGDNDTYRFTESTPVMGILAENPEWRTWFVAGGDYPTPAFYVLFAAPESDQAAALKGTYTLLIKGLVFETGSDLEAELVVFGQVHGAAGTDFMRRDLVVPLLWGLPFALAIGLFGAVTTTLFSLLVAAASAWLGGWVDALIQRIIEANIILPVLAIAVLFYSFYRIDIWFVLVFVVLLSGFGSPTKAFRAAFLQVKEAPYIEAARAYGVGNWRMIRHYMVPRILPMVIPSVVNLIPNFVFLEATLAIFGVSDPRYPTWGRILYSALRYGASYGSRYWVLEPIILLLITGLAFVLVGRALNHVLNPRLSIE